MRRSVRFGMVLTTAARTGATFIFMIYYGAGDADC